MTGWAIGNVVGASVLMLLVLAARRPVAMLFGAGWSYALWLVPFARLILPPLPLPEVAFSSLMPSLDIVVPASGGVTGSAGTSGAATDWTPFLLALWAAGAAVFLVWQFLQYRRFLNRLSLSSRSAGDFRGLPIVESGAVDGPIAVGLLDRRIVVPADFFVRYSESQRRLALEHEYVHHRRGDIWWNLAALVVLALNWWNPLAWASFVALRADQELACDAAVAARSSADERHDYACALVKSASRPGLIAACPLNHPDQLKRRLRMMKDHRSTRLRSFGGAAATLIIAGAGLSLAAPGAAHPHPEGAEPGKERRVIIMEHKAREGAEKGGADHVIRLRRHGGPGGHGELAESCPDGTELLNLNHGGEENRHRMILCSRPGATPAQRVEALERARTRLAEHDGMPEEHRARVLAEIDAAIARLRGQ
ncbi:M56 family metallopeptidase [Allosphingosinicella sp.]|jgi:beta-lactamase regulating signal transducer with metallopeptidase domain|uniref:M56 family metallopeptidase n=1 Tax=Allosphingosinicella sp. TaxID=2823234 RepID=UPI002F03D96B